MLAIGGLFVSIALLTLALLVPMFRRSDPPRWTTRSWIGEFVTVSIVSALALGVAYLGAGVIEAFRAGPDLLDLALLAGILLVAIVIWQRLSGARPKPARPASGLDAQVSGPARGAAVARPVPVGVSQPSPPQKAA